MYSDGGVGYRVNGDGSGDDTVASESGCNISPLWDWIVHLVIMVVAAVVVVAGVVVVVLMIMMAGSWID